MSATYYTLLTFAGQAQLANALALNKTVPLYSMAVGDGNGNATVPNAAQTSLVRETYRAQINQINVDPTNPNYLYCDLVVPTDVGGFSVTEAAIFTADGTLFAISNYPATYKPVLAEGSGKELVVRIYIEVTNVNQVELKIDPTVVLASRQWVSDNYAFSKEFPGGNTGNILAKKSNKDGDAYWFDPANGFSVFVKVSEEHQTLAAGQTIVNLSLLTTNGLALYIEGVREFDWIANTDTQLTLGQSYPNGTKVDFVQNNPTANTQDIDKRINRTITDSAQSLNTQDPTQLTTAILTLLNNALPAGLTLPYSGGTVPSGWLAADGSAVSRTIYPRLFTAIGTTYGVGDGTTTFNLPDLRGRTVIALDGGAGVVNSTATGVGGANANTLGGKGGEQVHSLTAAENGPHTHDVPVTNTYTTSGATITRSSNSPSTTNPTNSSGSGTGHNNMQPWIALNYIVKA